MKQVILDTETTGLDIQSGNRVIEIGCVEIIDRKFTGREFHTFLNPERAVEPGAFKVHGRSNDFLSDKPIFKDVYKDFLAFINDSELLIHNADFDIGFLNNEFKLSELKINISLSKLSKFLFDLKREIFFFLRKFKYLFFLNFS